MDYNFYPRPPRGGRPERLHSTAFDRTISIHALREEGDAQKQLDATAKGLFLSTPSARRATRRGGVVDLAQSISIHALREEGDGKYHADPTECGVFLSTPSARRATYEPKEEGKSERNFYPRPPRGGRPANAIALSDSRYFYPRPPRGGRRVSSYFLPTDLYFYPRPPRGGRLLLLRMLVLI